MKQNKRLSIGTNVLEDVQEASNESTSNSEDDDESQILLSGLSQKSRFSEAFEPEPEPAQPSPPKEVKKKKNEGEANQRKKSEVSESDSLGKQFKQAFEQVESIVPARIANAFNVLEARVKVLNESLMTNKNNSLVAWEEVLPALYFQL